MKKISTQRLKEALQQADLRALLMVLFHMTGDRKWLSPPFMPMRDVLIIAPLDAGLPEEAQQAIRQAAEELLSDSNREPAIQDPGDELMVEMMSVCLGENVPPEYAPMMREEMGLISREVTWSAPEKPAAVQHAQPVLIVGAGATGIAIGHNLKSLGIPFAIIEKNGEVGGTWLVNDYPGCAVDTPNHAYSYSFGKRYPWSRYFSPREELQDYLERSATDLGLRPYIRFNTEVTQADWDEASACWKVRIRTEDGREEILQAPALISAIGQLSQPFVPEIDGAETFEGPLFHSTEWPENLDLTDKRIAIIGTGATSMQVVPSIVDQVGAMTIYQRSAQWARPIPGYHDNIGEGAQWLLAEVPLYASWYRFLMLWRYGDGLLSSLHKDPHWEHPERSLNRANDRHRQQMTDHILSELADRPDLVEKCLPTYPPYGKRILLDNGWFQSIKQPHVELVTDHIRRIVPNGIETVDGQIRKADVILLATGFKVSQMAARLNITGRDGLNLAEAWRDDNPSAYLGITVPGFPNLFITQGPNTGLGHGGSAIFQSECQSRYIINCLTAMHEQNIAAIEVSQDAHDEFVASVDAEHEKMVWTHPGMSTYYRNAKGRVVSVSPWRLVDYWGMTHDVDLTPYHIRKRAS